MKLCASCCDVLRRTHHHLGGTPAKSAQFSCSVMSDSLRPHGLKHARSPCPSPTPRTCSNWCPSSWWCHPTISSSVVPFSSCLQSFPASGSFLRSQFFISGGQSIDWSFSFSIVLPMNIQDWFHLELTGLISLQGLLTPCRVSKGLSRVFSNNTVQKHQFFILSLLYGPNFTFIRDYWKTTALTKWTFVSKVMSLFLICCLGWS